MTETAGEGNPLGSLNDEMELSAPFTAKSVPYMGWAVEEKIIEQKRVGWFCFPGILGTKVCRVVLCSKQDGKQTWVRP